jgi:hypothetical protein
MRRGRPPLAVVTRAEQDFRAMMIWKQGEFFCVGANLFAVVMAAGQKQWDQLREMIEMPMYLSNCYSTEGERGPRPDHRESPLLR